MRLTILSDNRTLNADLMTEHGLCAHLDMGKIKILLDTGASDIFVRNASVLGIDLTDVDYIFISHGHRDHASGLPHILKENAKAKIIVSSIALSESFYSSRKGMHDITPAWPYILMRDRLISVDKEMEIDGMKVIPNIAQHYPIPKANKCLYKKSSDGDLIHDDFKHELVLQIEDFLFTGCAHNGLMNIIKSVSGPIHTVLGGFHLLDASENEDFESEIEIQEIASNLLTKHPESVFYTGHCTGDNVFMSMKKILGHNLRQFSCGMSLEI